MLRRFPSGYCSWQTVSVQPWRLRFGRHGKGRTVRLLDFPKATRLAAKPGLKIPSPECSDSYVNCPGVVPLQDPGTGGLVTERYCRKLLCQVSLHPRGCSAWPEFANSTSEQKENILKSYFQ